MRLVTIKKWSWLFGCVLCVLFLEQSAEAQGPNRWYDQIDFGFSLHQGAGISVGQFEGIPIETDLLVNINFIKHDYSQYRYTNPDFWSRNRGYNFQLIPEFGVSNVTNLGRAANAGGLRIGIYLTGGLRVRKMWNNIGLSASAHLLFGVLGMYDDEGDPPRRVEAWRISVGGRVGVQIDFIHPGYLGIEFVYLWQTDLAVEHNNSFIALFYVDFIRIFENVRMPPLIMTGRYGPSFSL